VSASPASDGYVTPIVRKLANELGVNLATVSGTGVGGRIRKEDVLAAAETSGGSQGRRRAAAAPEVSPLRGTVQPMSRLRKVIAERAVASMQATAQLTTVVEVDVTAVAQLRDRVKAEFQAKVGTKLSFMPFFAVAATEALQSYPIINATVDGDNIVYPDFENLSIAVDTERGLLTPVVKNAAGLTIAEFATQIADLATRTRDNKLTPDALSGGTFTLTNTGSRGALFDTPLVFMPQVAILGTGAVVKKPVVVETEHGEGIAVRSTVFLALSYDHRIVDGADAARFLTQVKNRLEDGAFEANLGF
jgi:2-oxoglutarate dehydrogenase E2 component (dihydrolipoamide succinyltransferase)